jgi:hypothetical protein
MAKTVGEIAQHLNNRGESTGRDHVAVFGKDGHVAVVEKRVQFSEEFSFTFSKNLNKVVMHSQLGGTALRVLHRIMELTSQGNIVDTSQSGMAIDLGVSRQAISKAWKELRTAGILLLDRSGNEHMNVNLCYRGSPKDLVKGEGRERLEQGYKALKHLGITKVVNV